MAFNSLLPSLSQNMGPVIDSTRENLNDLNTRLVTQESDTADLPALRTAADAAAAHAAETSNPHGIATLRAAGEATQAEVTAARGSLATVADRLAVALQSNGAIKLSTLASKWIDNGDVPTYISSTSFSVPNNRTGVYIGGVLLRFTTPAGYVYAPGASSAFTSVTTVTLDPAYPVLTAGITKVEIALIAFDNAIAAAVTQANTDIADLQGQITAIRDIGSGAGDPTSTEVPAGKVRVWKNTTSGALKLWANDGGTLKSVTLT